MQNIPVDPNRIGSMKFIGTAAKLDDKGVQQTDKETGDLKWAVQCLNEQPERKAELREITVAAAEAPEFPPLTEVTLNAPSAFYWTGKEGRSGVSWRAESIVPARSKS